MGHQAELVLVTAVETARALVHAKFPDALVALLAGSAAGGVSTPTSDLDIVVILGGPPAPYRETLLHHGKPVELFAHTRDSLEEWWRREAGERRNTLADMCAQGIVLLDRGDAEAVRRAAAAVLAAGPAALSDTEAKNRRYALTDALDDLTGADDRDERDAVAGLVLQWAAELALLSRRCWLGRGKWLVRRLRETDPGLADHLLAAHRRCVADGDPSGLVAVADKVLSGVGGRLTEGFRAG